MYCKVRHKLLFWKFALEVKGLKVNMNKTRRVELAISVRIVKIFCTTCGNWIHERSGIIANVGNVQNFECSL